MANKKVDVIIPDNVRRVVTKYILHFNIDQTLLLNDQSKLSKEDQVNKREINNWKLTLMMVHFAWGKPDEKKKFKLTQNLFSKSPKDTDSISFYQFVELILPLGSDPEENNKILQLRHE
jgi:hypothetical protein